MSPLLLILKGTCTMNGPCQSLNGGSCFISESNHMLVEQGSFVRHYIPRNLRQCTVYITGPVTSAIFVSNTHFLVALELSMLI